MWLTILKGLTPTNLLAVISLVLAVLVGTAFTQLKKVKEDRDIQYSNYENILEQNSRDIVELTLKKDKDLERYLEQNKVLHDLIEEQDIKLKKLIAVTHLIHKDKDTTTLVHETKIVEYIKTETKGVVQWKDSTECFTIEGRLIYDGSDVSVAVDSREYKTDIALTSSWRRNQKNFFTRLFGRKEVIAKVNSTCGTTKTFIITRK